MNNFKSNQKNKVISLHHFANSDFWAFAQKIPSPKTRNKHLMQLSTLPSSCDQSTSDRIRSPQDQPWFQSCFACELWFQFGAWISLGTNKRECLPEVLFWGVFLVLTRCSNGYFKGLTTPVKCLHNNHVKLYKSYLPWIKINQTTSTWKNFWMN